jgi:biopolymer transport protein ExbD
MTFDHGETDDLRADINVTPLVDVMLVLLVVFMVVTPLLHLQVPIELPQARTAEEPPTVSQVRVAVGADGTLHLNDDVVTLDGLPGALTAVLAGRDEKTIFLEADRSLPYATVVDVIDVCRQAGVVRVGMLTSRRQPGPDQ